MAARKETPEAKKLRMEWEKRLREEGLVLSPDEAISSGLPDHRDVADGGCDGLTTED